MQQQPQGNIQVRNALLVFCKDMANPLVLYFDNTQKIYEDLKALMNSTDIKMVEFEPIGSKKRLDLILF